MDRSDLQASAEFLVSSYRDVLNIDPYFNIKVEVGEGDFVSHVEEDQTPASWILKLNPERHNDLIDIQYSVVDILIKILFRFLDKNEHTNEVISRVTTGFVQLLPVDFDESVYEEGEEDEF